MDPAKIKAALDALVAQDYEACAQILQDVIVQAASGGEEPPADAPADISGETLDAPVEDPLAPKPEEKVAALSQLRTLTGKASLGEILVALSAWKDDRDAADLAQAKLDEGARAELVNKLVKLHAETPGTAWADPAKKIPAARLSAEPIAELRSRVSALRVLASASPKPAPGAKPPVTAAGEGRIVKTSRGDVALSASEIKNCEALSANVETYAENKAIRDAARAGKTAK